MRLCDACPWLQWHELGPRQQALIEVLVPPATGTGRQSRSLNREGGASRRHHNPSCSPGTSNLVCAYHICGAWIQGMPFLDHVILVWSRHE